MNVNIKFLNGFGGLLKNISIKLVQFFPVYMIVFVAYGDKFLPSPLSDFSANTRNTINGTLMGAFNEDMLQNDKYNNKKSDKVLEELEKQK
ncbi:hypothetical protein [Geminocystis herdmanii]|uniref:hypothetical protein n=1 Tax=Geminocystis herdmanii TaxID=669359 RepID=UPI00034BED64|nr:hypothetical protein [Geminocystis herdmanii]